MRKHSERIELFVCLKLNDTTGATYPSFHEIAASKIGRETEV